MCHPFSCIVMRDRSVKVHPNATVHSHDEILSVHHIKDHQRQPGTTYVDPDRMTFARIEIPIASLLSFQPPTGYTVRLREAKLKNVKLDESITPTWFNDTHKKAALAAYFRWLNSTPLPNLHRSSQHDRLWWHHGCWNTVYLSYSILPNAAKNRCHIRLNHANKVWEALTQVPCPLLRALADTPANELPPRYAGEIRKFLDSTKKTVKKRKPTKKRSPTRTPKRK